MDSKTIAIAGEITPAKTIIPVVKKLRNLDEEDKLSFKIDKIIGLYHGESAKTFLEPYCDELLSIGEGRRGAKNSTPKLAYLISRDILKAFNALRGRNIDLLITAGNAGDVRKSIIAANLLGIPILHIEQDIYNPIEVISQANIVTVPSEKYESLVKEKYQLRNVVNIQGYPMAKYVEDYLDGNLISREDIYDEFAVRDFVLAVLGGDLKDEDIPPLVEALEALNLYVLIAPYRFKKEFVESFVISPNVKVLEEHVDLVSFLNASSSLIFAAGMGITIEAGVLNVPSIKIEGFHKTHGSVDLAKELNMPIVKISDIPETFEHLKGLNSGDLIKNSEMAIDKIVELINNFDYNSKRSGLSSARRIWNQRKAFR